MARHDSLLSMRNLIGMLMVAMSLTAAVKIDKVGYDGWPNCYRISNGEVEVILTSDVGPRIMRYAFVGGGRNVFAEFKDDLGKTNEATWKARGGHRLWMGPESIPDTYALDNQIVDVSVEGSVVTATQAVEPETGLQKVIEIRMAESGSKVELTHRLIMRGQQSRELAPWALSMMAPGGIAVHGLPTRGSHDEFLLPTNPLTMWAYTDFTDKRWILMHKYIGLRQDPTNKSPQKAGSFNENTWAAYLLGDTLFIKRTKADKSAKYPDFGSSYEMFVSDAFLEIETLGPLVRLSPGQKVEHVETWTLHKGVSLPKIDDANLDRVVKPLL